MPMRINVQGLTTPPIPPVGAVFNSIQSGSLNTVNKTGTAAISAVDMSKTMLLQRGNLAFNHSLLNDYIYKGLIKLNNSTTVYGERYQNNAISIVEYFTVLEFASGIQSIQRGLITVAAASATEDVTISAVDTSRTFINWLGSYSGDGHIDDRYTYLSLTSPTNLRATRTGVENTSITSFEIIEFE